MRREIPCRQDTSGEREVVRWGIWDWLPDSPEGGRFWQWELGLDLIHPVPRSTGSCVLCFAVEVMLAHKLPLLPSVFALLLVYFLGDPICLLSRLMCLCGLPTPGSELVAGSHILKMCNRACCFNAKDSTVRPFQTQST